MCMTINGTKKLHNGETVYKVVCIDGSRYSSLTNPWSRSQQTGFSLGTEMSYKIGGLHTSEAPGIYVYLDFRDALRISGKAINRAVLKCYIPKGSNVYYGTQNDAAVYGTEKLIPLEEV